ncbi:hypothetical protein IDVR_19880 [Intrasporangium sp. DVR]
MLTGLAHDLAAAALADQPVAHLVRSLVRSLVGSGRGLTPSGDDAVAGVLLALRSGGELGAVRAVDDQVRAVSHTTTSISAALLRAAAQGYAAPEVVALVDLLAPSRLTPTSGQRVARALERVLAIGHSSGRDLVSGLAGARRALAAHLPTRTIPEGAVHG